MFHEKKTTFELLQKQIEIKEQKRNIQVCMVNC